MNKEKYNRAAKDSSQLQQFVDETCDEINSIEKKSIKKIETSDISALSDETLDALKVGDVVQKITGNMKHCYTVTYKQEHKGICLSYFDAGYLETISYDYTAGHWVFNSKDVSDVSSSNIYELPEEPTQAQLAEATKHKFIKTTDSMVFVLFRSEVEEDTSNIYHYYGCTYAYDDGIRNGGLDILEIGKISGHYGISEYIYNFEDILRFDSQRAGQVLVVGSDGLSSPQDFFTAFTHSLAELDETLRDIIQDSIADAEPKSCTQAQWNAIKSLLDKSLYFNYEGVSYIRVSTNGIDNYLFGDFFVKAGSLDSGTSLRFNYENGTLYVEYAEI